MARKIKIVLEKDFCVDKRAIGYYSTPKFVSDYIYNTLLSIKPDGQRVLDTCVGNEELIEPFINAGMKCTGVDVHQYSSSYRCEFIHQDFFSFCMQHKNNNFDFLIANPPYNCHENDYIINNKIELKKMFPIVGIHNMYSMFISAMIDMAKEGAVLGLISFDSFLTNKAHTELRKKILNQCIIHEIILAPSDLFSDQQADVRTAILILEKKTNPSNKKITLYDRPMNSNDFQKALSSRDFFRVPLDYCILSGKQDNHEFIINKNQRIIDLFKNKRIGGSFKVVTGISTGNDKKYLSAHKTDTHTIPFYKNPGKNKFFCEENSYLITDFMLEKTKQKNFMVRNAQLIGREGIVCSSVGVEFSSCYLPKNTAFGVNPTIFSDNADDLWWMLAYLNSDLVKYLLRGIILRSNMVTSGYVSRIPLLLFTLEEKLLLEELAHTSYKKMKNNLNIDEEIKAINKIVFEHLKLPNDLIHSIQKFCENIIKST